MSAETTDDPGAAGRASGAQHADIGTLRGRVADEIERLDRELNEIGLLEQQARSETERHATRRTKGEERVVGLEHEGRPEAAELREARTQLLTLTRRASLFEAQQQVLEGKQRTLQRFRDRLAELDSELAELDPTALRSGPRTGRAAAAPTGPDSATVQRAQEDMRRDIARQMHDGPAQSLANIALQAEIVERLIGRGDPRASTELGSLRRMVQTALEATKVFIFDIRPMVLDDLGLVPTLRRTAIDRGRRSGVEIDFDTQGADRRLSPDLESGVFRLLDEAITAYLGLHPERVTLRLDWGDFDLTAVVRISWPAATVAESAKPVEPEVREDLPPALAAMIEQKRADERSARTAARTVVPERLAELEERARGLGVAFAVREDGQMLELTIRLA